MQNISTLICEQFSQLQPYKAGLTSEAIKAKFDLDNVYKFASNESPFPPSELAVKAINDAISNVNRYPDYHALRAAIGDEFQLQAENVLLGSGAINLLDLVFQAFSKENSNVVFTSSAYFAYPLLAQKTGLKTKLAAPDDALNHDVKNLIAQCDEHTSLLAIDNPGNFSGAALNVEQLEQLLTQINPNTIVILDQAYEEFTELDSLEISPSLFDRFPNLIVTRTFSKAYSLAAMRVGYALGSAELIDWLSRGQQAFPVTNLGVAAAIASLQDKEYKNRVVTSIKQGRKALFEGLTALGLSCYPSHSNFVLAEFGEKASDIYNTLLKEGFITRQMQVYNRPDMIRISVGSQDENTKLLAKLAHLLS